ncbi:MAG: hypothetical protein QXU18_07250 [Thermoplasmatales archaeon]
MSLSSNPRVAMEASTIREYGAKMLRNIGFSVHLADPVRISAINQSEIKGGRILQGKPSHT